MDTYKSHDSEKNIEEAKNNESCDKPTSNETNKEVANQDLTLQQEQLFQPYFTLSKILVFKRRYDFLTTDDMQDILDNYQSLTDNNLGVVDVSGDGNCGFYAYMLGQIDIGMRLAPTLDKEKHTKEMLSLRKKVRDTMESNTKNFLTKHKLYEIGASVTEFKNLARKIYSKHFDYKDVESMRSVDNQDRYYDINYTNTCLAVEDKVHIVSYSYRGVPGKHQWSTHIFDGRNVDGENGLLQSAHEGIMRVGDDNERTIQLLFHGRKLGEGNEMNHCIYITQEKDSNIIYNEWIKTKDWRNSKK